MDESLKYHVPALLEESIEGLNIHAFGTYIDVTFGGGGHTKAILKKMDKNGRLFGFDQDADAEKNIPKDKRFVFVRSNFRYLSNFIDWHSVESIDGILADLGVSSHHFDDETRGFSFRFDGNLDMRMNKRAGKTAADILNNYSEGELANVFYLYGELRNSRPISKAIIKARTQQKIQTTQDLLEILKPFFGREKEKKQLAQAFQSLRLEANQEIEALKELLIQSEKLLKQGGRIAVISYQSLEDRLVKNFFRSGNFEGNLDKDIYGNINTPFRLIKNKVIVPSQEEISKNPRSRSAKLRIAEKL